MQDYIKGLDLNLLKALDALLELRSVTRAAERLGVTQPAVSGMLTRLREAFHDPLFIRAQYGMLPTPRAEALAGPLKAALREIEDLLRPEKFDPASAEMTIRIACTDYAQRAVILPFLVGLRRSAPGIRVSIRPVDMTTLARDLDLGQLDFALLTPEMAPEHLRARRLFEERYVCVMRESHPAARRPLDLDAFCALDHALMSHDGTRFYGVADSALEAIERSRRVVLSAPNFSFVLDLIRATDICALLPERQVRGEAGVCLREPPLDVPGFTKLLVWHERTQRDLATSWLREQIAASVD